MADKYIPFCFNAKGQTEQQTVLKNGWKEQKLSKKQGKTCEAVRAGKI